MPHRQNITSNLVFYSVYFINLSFLNLQLSLECSPDSNSRLTEFLYWVRCYDNIILQKGQV